LGLVRAGACAWTVASLVLGCGKGDDDPIVQPGEQESAFCEAQCTRDIDCGGPGPTSACEANCAAFVTGLGDLRPEAVEIADKCILQLPCATFYDDGAFVPCWEKAARELGPTESTRRFCIEWSTRWFECGSAYSVEKCESDWANDNAGYLERMSVCIESDCDSLDACAQNVQAGGAG
jgi:hypothetical protein